MKAGKHVVSKWGSASGSIENAKQGGIKSSGKRFPNP